MTALPSIAEMGRQLRAKQTSSQALTLAALDRIAAADSALHAFITVTADHALHQARAADAAFAAGKDHGPFQGIPYALKDIYDTAGIRTTCHSKLLLDNVPTQDCVVAQKLTQAGGVMLGKLATHEFAIGGPSFDLPFPPRATPGTSTTSPAARPPAPAPRSPPASSAWPWARTPAAPSAAPPPIAASSASNPPTAESAAAASSRSPTPWTTPAPWRAP